MFPPNIDPQVFSLSAAIVGAAVAPQFTANEANSVGNWIVLVGDYLLAYAGQVSLIQGRQNMQNTTSSMNSQKEQMDFLIQALQKMECEIEKLKREYHS